MNENLIFPKIVTRGNPDKTEVSIGGLTGQVEYTSGWGNVEGGKGVTCRTWKVAGSDDSNLADGADIKIEAGGYTPVQLVKSARVVVDAPESGDVYCIVMAPGNTEAKVIPFDSSNKSQMVWEQGTIICWIAKKETRLTEFESPSFNAEMFTNIPDGQIEFEERDLSKLCEKVYGLRESVKV